MKSEAPLYHRNVYVSAMQSWKFFCEGSSRIEPSGVKGEGLSYFELLQVPLVPLQDPSLKLINRRLFKREPPNSGDSVHKSWRS
jgi:hypothetical protein